MQELQQDDRVNRVPNGFVQALRYSATPSIIAEIKRGSPSRGIMSPDLDAAHTAHAYKTAGASAISVLTDENYFNGTLEDLRQVRKILPEMPLLRKDFMLEDYQIWESKIAGADAVLLIASCLDDLKLSGLLHSALGLGLDVLCEVHDQKELERALKILSNVKSDIENRVALGINNRNLKTFVTDLSVAENLSRICRQNRALGVGENMLLVAESGINSAEDIARLHKVGIGAYLIGESLIRSANPGSALENLLKDTKRQLAGRTHGFDPLNRTEHESAADTSEFTPKNGGHYGPYGGRYAPEILMPALEELENCFTHARTDTKFLADLRHYYTNFIGRPSPLTPLKNISTRLGGAQIFLKNEGALLTGAHKINHCVGQILLAKHMGKKRIVAETGAGQHGVATATVCATFGLECVIYMGALDMARQRPNVFWMEQLGARVIPVHDGGQRLKDAVNAAIKDWITNVANTHYLLGSCLGPHPFPEANRFFQSIIGDEIKQQLNDYCGSLPDYVIACVGGGSNSIGAFNAFLNEPEVRLIGVEAGGHGIESHEHAARFVSGRIGVVEGYKSYWLLDDAGQVSDTHSISAGLDYAGVGPLHAWLHDNKRVQYVFATDEEVIQAFQTLAREEGIIAALESSHAVAYGLKLAPQLSQDKIIVVNMSGRGDKDLFIVAEYLQDQEFFSFIENYATKRR